MIKKILDIFSDSLDSFEGQREEERVEMLVRRHFFTILPPLLGFGLGCIVPIVVGMAFLGKLASYDLALPFIFLASMWYSFIWLGIFYTLTMYTLDVIIVTNKRILDSDQKEFFNRKVAELNMDRIQDASAHTNGLIETLLNFGDITVQSAASEKHFVFHKVPKPDKIRDSIMRIADAENSPKGI